MSANDNQMSDKDFKEIKEKESDELVLNCRKPEGELGEKMIQRPVKSCMPILQSSTVLWLAEVL